VYRVVAHLQLSIGHAFAAGRDDVDPTLTSAVGLLQEPALGIVELSRPTIDGQGNKLLLDQFLASLGTGDMGERVALPDGRQVDRLPEVHKRRYVSIFGTFELTRTVYGSREGQKIEFVPLDNRLQLPESVFSYVLQDWDQSFCVEQAFGPCKCGNGHRSTAVTCCT